MRKDIADKWVKRLRDGGIEQCSGSLAINDARCCLGVLCDIAAEENPETFFWGDPKDAFEEQDLIMFGESIEGSRSFGSKDSRRSRAVLPESVATWAGLMSTTGFIQGRGDFDDKLTVLNDKGVSFTEIADIIEQQWEHL